MTHDQFDRNKRYLTAMCFVRDMLLRGLINEKECSALETKFADAFLPLVRYEKPCFHAVDPVTQTVERRATNEPNHTENPANT